jgi:methyl-galactoside transport system permease protein
VGTNAKLTIKQRLENFKAMEKEDKRRWWGEFFIDNSLYIFLIAAIIGIAVYNPNFVSMKSIINIVSLSAANLPIALGIAGAIILTGTDLSAGRVVGLTACVAASLLQSAEYPNKMFPGIGTVPGPIVILGGHCHRRAVGAVNGFCTAKFQSAPVHCHAATQLIVYGTLLIYLMQGNNNGQSISGLDKSLYQSHHRQHPFGAGRQGNMVPTPTLCGMPS